MYYINIFFFSFILHIPCIHAHHIRISDNLSGVRNSYLINVILSRLSRVRCLLVALELVRMVVKWYHCYVKVMSSYNITSQRFPEFLGGVLNVNCGISW